MTTRLLQGLPGSRQIPRGQVAAALRQIGGGQQAARTLQAGIPGNALLQALQLTLGIGQATGPQLLLQHTQGLHVFIHRRQVVRLQRRADQQRHKQQAGQVHDRQTGQRSGGNDHAPGGPLVKS